MVILVTPKQLLKEMEENEEIIQTEPEAKNGKIANIKRFNRMLSDKEMIKLTDN